MEIYEQNKLSYVVLFLPQTKNFLMPKTLQPDDVNFWYFKLRLFDLTEFTVWKINQWCTTWGCKDIGSRKSEIAAKT